MPMFRKFVAAVISALFGTPADVSCWGDSRSRQNWIESLTTPSPLARSWLWWLEALSQRVRMNYKWNQGISGDSIAQLRYRIENDVANASGIKPSQVPIGVAILHIGTNSVYAGVPLWPVTTAGTMSADYTFCLEWLLKQGHKVICIAEWPRGKEGATGSESPLLLAANQKLMYGLANFIRDQRHRANVYISDIWGSVADPTKTDARPLEGFLNADYLHQANGMGFVQGADLARIVDVEMSLPKAKLFPGSNGDVWDAATNLRGCLVTNPMLQKGAGGTLGANASGDVPEGWTLTGKNGITVAGSFVTVVVDGVKRTVFRMTCSGTTTANNAVASLRQTGLQSKVSPGEVINGGYGCIVSDGHVNFAAPACFIDPNVAADRAYGGLSITNDKQLPTSAVTGFQAAPRTADYTVPAIVPASLAFEITPSFSVSGVASSLVIDILCAFPRKKI